MATEIEITNYIQEHYGGSDCIVDKWDSKPLEKSTINSPHMNILGEDVCLTFASPNHYGCKRAIYWNYLPNN